MSYETDVKKLEEISNKLKDENTSLEESMRLFEEGSKLIKTLSKQLSEFEGKILKLTEDEEKAVQFEE